MHTQNTSAKTSSQQQATQPPTPSNTAKGKRVELIIHQLNSLPTLPAVAARLLQITVRSDTQAQEVVQLIESDPALSSKIIALSTRAGTGISKRTASVGKAVVMLGFEAVRNAVLSIKVFETLRRQDEQDQQEDFDRIGFWKHSLAVACAARLLSKHIDRQIDPEEAFVCGLLHDLGKVALDTCLPKSFARVVQLTDSSMANIAEVEQKLLGLDHMVVGKRLAEKWRLPTAITESIWLHQLPADSLPQAVEYRSIVQTIHLADLLAREQKIGYSGNYQMTDTATKVAEKLGCPTATLRQIARELPEQISERAVLLGLDDMAPQELYHEALGMANNELGRLNVKLQQQNQKLLMRSSYFELLGRLSGGLTDCSSVTDVCGLIAQLWQQHNKFDIVAVYASVPDEPLIEGAVHSSEPGESSVFLVDFDETDDMAGSGQTSQSAGFAISAAGPQHDWFFEQVGPIFDRGRTLVVPLQSGDTAVGEILWQAAEKQNDYKSHIKELQAFASYAALAIHQGQKQEKQSRLSEQLAQINQMLRQVQQELLQKRSLAAVGEMACGAAHEVNNPLAVVVGRAQILAGGEEDPARKKTLEVIAQNGKEVSQIISELMEFAKPPIPKPESVKIDKLLAEAVETIDRQAQQNKIEIETDTEQDIPEAFLDKQQFVKAIAELLGNAIESYQGAGGRIEIKTAYSELDEAIIIRIFDRGCGMDAETVEKAFDPFFSARSAGRGRGLGLSRAIRYLQAGGAELELVSELKKGTLAKVTLPVS